MSQHLHNSDSSIGDGRPIDRSDENAAGEEGTRLADDAIDDVKNAHKQAALRVDDHVDAVALRTGDLHCAVTLLLLVDPALQAGFVHPFSGAFALAWAHPLRGEVVVFARETHPAVFVVT